MSLQSRGTMRLPCGRLRPARSCRQALSCSTRLISSPRVVLTRSKPSRSLRLHASPRPSDCAARKTLQRRGMIVTQLDRCCGYEEHLRPAACASCACVWWCYLAVRQSHSGFLFCSERVAHCMTHKQPLTCQLCARRWLPPQEGPARHPQCARQLSGRRHPRRQLCRPHCCA